MRPLLFVALLLTSSAPPHFELPPPVSALLETGKWDSTPKSFRIIVLSNVADGCVAQARAVPGSADDAKACVAKVLKLARKLQPNDDGLFLSHLNLIYGAADEVGLCPGEAEHRRVSELLARRSLADPLRHAASYASTSLRWPADQSATLASLARFDAAHGTTLVQAPLAAWKQVLEQHLDPDTKLPVSELTGRGPGAKYPRGCAQSWLIRYTSEFDPALASAWWETYRAQFLVRVGPIVGFREWPVGVERAGDVDSGPIIFGVGTAASAFAIPAARSQGDVLLAGQLLANQDTLLAADVGGKVTGQVLVAAISFEGRWHPLPSELTAK
ncbi:MAG: hypothetical protein U0228_26535 [Myxococcaceae bacterium]